MKKMFLVLSLFLCAAYVAAQTSPSQSTNPTSSQSNPTSSQSTSDHQTKVRGCLSGSNGNYTLTEKSGKAVQLSGDTSKLTEHVGHTVEISGTESSPTTGSSAASSSAAGSTTGPTLNVTSVKHISPTCSTGSSSSPSH